VQLAKRFLMPVLFSLGATFLLVVLTTRIPAGPPMPMAVGNGDLNGAGEIGVSDTVHLLVYLLRGGEPPAATAVSCAIVEEKIVENVVTDAKLDALVALSAPTSSHSWSGAFTGASEGAGLRRSGRLSTAFTRSSHGVWV